MATCEPCWYQALLLSRMLGGSQVDHYRKLLAEIEHDDNIQED